MVVCGEDMVKGYVLITAAVGKMRETREKIESLERVQKVDMVTGPYDLIVVAESDDLSTLTSTVVDEIRKTEGVIDTNTAVVIE